MVVHERIAGQQVDLGFRVLTDGIYTVHYVNTALKLGQSASDLPEDPTAAFTLRTTASHESNQYAQLLSTNACFTPCINASGNGGIQAKRATRLILGDVSK